MKKTFCKKHPKRHAFYNRRISLQDHMSVRATEQYIKNLSGNTSRQSRKNEQEKDPGISAIENTMSRRLGTKVNIANKTITVIYDGTSDLNRILDLMGMIEE